MKTVTEHDRAMLAHTHLGEFMLGALAAARENAYAHERYVRNDDPDDARAKATMAASDAAYKAATNALWKAFYDLTDHFPQEG